MPEPRPPSLRSSACVSTPDDDGGRTVTTENSFSYFVSAFGDPLATYGACQRAVTGVVSFLTPMLIQVTTTFAVTLSYVV